MEASVISIDGVEYVQRNSLGDVKIVVLQRGWALVGRFSRNGDDCSLDDANVIRQWGTTRGLGEIATGGPTKNTKLDPCGHVDFHILTSVMIIACKEEKWSLK